MRNVVVALLVGAVVEVVWAAPPQIFPFENCSREILAEVEALSRKGFQDFLGEWFESAQYSERHNLPADPYLDLFVKIQMPAQGSVSTSSLDPDAVNFLFFLYEQLLWKRVNDLLYPHAIPYYQDEAAVRASEYLLKEYSQSGIKGHMRWVKLLEINRTTFWNVARDIFQSMEKTVLQTLRHRAQWN